MPRKWEWKMIYILILLFFNLFVIILLSNIKPPSFHNFIEYKIPPTMRLQNKGVIFNEIEINKYHSLYKTKINDSKEDKNNE